MTLTSHRGEEWQILADESLFIRCGSDNNTGANRLKIEKVIGKSHPTICQASLNVILTSKAEKTGAQSRASFRRTVSHLWQPIWVRRFKNCPAAAHHNFKRSEIG